MVSLLGKDRDVMTQFYLIPDGSRGTAEQIQFINSDAFISASKFLDISCLKT